MTCPVCMKEYPNKVTKCEVCGFTYERGINPIHLNPEEGKIWFDTVVKPYREQWQQQEKEKKAYQAEQKRQEQERQRQEEMQWQAEEEIRQQTAISSQDEQTAWSYFREGERRLSKRKTTNPLFIFSKRFSTALPYENESKNNKLMRIAIEDFSTAIQYKPDFALAYFRRAEVLAALKQKDSAINDLLTAKNLGIDARYMIPLEAMLLKLDPFGTIASKLAKRK